MYKYYIMMYYIILYVRSVEHNCVDGVGGGVHGGLYRGVGVCVLYQYELHIRVNHY